MLHWVAYYEFHRLVESFSPGYTRSESLCRIRLPNRLSSVNIRNFVMATRTGYFASGIAKTKASVTER
jgi:hypothetical protein